MDEKKRDRIINRLEKQPLSKEQLQNEYHISNKECRSVLDSFGSLLHFDGVLYHVNRSTLPNYDKSMPLTFDRDEKIGMVADKHMCSKYHALASMQEAYDIYEKEGVKHVFDAGDLTDGYMVYKGQLDDLVAWGEPAQREYVVKNHPKRKGITTHVIAGNHDSSTLLRGGTNIVENISKERPDIHYCGMHYARFNINNKTKFDLIHDTARRAYAISYPSQVRQRDTPPEARPDMSLAGHRHVAFYAYYNGEHMLEGGCFEKSSPYMRGRGINATIASWLTELTMQDGAIKRIKPQLLVFK